MHKNTCLHYIALFDQEDFIHEIVNVMQSNSAFTSQLKTLTEEKNLSERSPMDFFERGKKDSYVLLQSLLHAPSDTQLTTQSSSDNIGLIKS